MIKMKLQKMDLFISKRDKIQFVNELSLSEFYVSFFLNIAIVLLNFIILNVIVHVIAVLVKRIKSVLFIIYCLYPNYIKILFIFIAVS